jgi:hypothetical protein
MCTTLLLASGWPNRDESAMISLICINVKWSWNDLTQWAPKVKRPCTGSSHCFLRFCRSVPWRTAVHCWENTHSLGTPRSTFGFVCHAFQSGRIFPGRSSRATARGESSTSVRARGMLLSGCLLRDTASCIMDMIKIIKSINIPCCLTPFSSAGCTCRAHRASVPPPRAGSHFAELVRKHAK